MKRTRDGNPTGLGLHPKRLAMSCIEPFDEALSRAVTEQRTMDDAFDYLMTMKDILKDKKKVYNEFLKEMRLFKYKSISDAEVISRVERILKGHHELLLGFSTFLPEGYKAALCNEEEPAKKTVEFSEATSYTNKVKVASLFSDHQDLRDDFMRFMPDTRWVACPCPTQEFLRGSMPWKDYGGMLFNSPRHGKLGKRKKMATRHYDRGLSSKKQIDRQASDCVYETGKEHPKKAKYKSDEEKDREESNAEDEQDSDAVQHLSNKCKLAQKGGDKMHKLDQLGGAREATEGLPRAVHVMRLPKSLQKKLGFFEKLKMRLGNKDYLEFLKCLKMYAEEVINRADMHKLVDDILGSFKDLMEAFNEFLNDCESYEGLLANNMSKRLDDGTCSTLKVQKDKKMQKESNDFERDRGNDSAGHRTELEDETEKGSVSCEAPREALNNKEKYLAKPISEPNLSDCERCTPSYRRLPHSYPKPLASDVSGLAREALNDAWVSVTCGSEDYSLKHMRKNMYEEMLLRCEDDRFELDMLLETTDATIKRGEEFLEKYKKDSEAQNYQVCLEHYLEAIHMRCIERIYGDHGLDFVDRLRKNVSVALPVILGRLKQKQKEWSECRAEMNKIWADVYAECYHKTLDHRSFYFKQQDKKI